MGLAHGKVLLHLVLGLAVGDALGAGSEGHPMQPTPIRDLTPPPGVVVRWTDDTQRRCQWSRTAARSAVVTHAHPQGVAGAVATALAGWHAARSRGGRAPDAAELLEAIVATLSADSAVARRLDSARELPSTTPLGEAVDVLGNGSRVSCADTVPLALWLAFSPLDDYQGAVQRAVAGGGDTDTPAAIVGGIVAARVSLSGIPARWRGGLEPLPPPFGG